MTDSVDLGNGVRIPMLGFGTWRLSGQQAYDCVSYALGTGYRHIDHVPQRVRGRPRRT